MDGKVQGLLAANIFLEGLKKFMDLVQPVTAHLLIAVQILVGLATAYYFWRKGRAVRVPKRKKKLWLRSIFDRDQQQKGK